VVKLARCFARRCAASLVDLSLAFSVLTPSGGKHYYFRGDGHVIRNSVGKLAPGVDVRGVGGYVVAYSPDVPHAGALQPLPGAIATALRGSSDQAEMTPVAVESSNVTDGDRAYGMAALRAEYDKLATTHSGRNHALNCAANALGEFVASGMLDEETVILALRDASDRNGYSAKDGVEERDRTMFSGLSSGKQRPRPLPSQQATMAPVSSGAHQPWQQSPSPFAPLKSFDPDTIPSIFDFEYKQVEFLIPNVLPTSSVTMISGDSGCGKTTFVLKLSLALATGNGFLGSRPAPSRKVLYVDRENTVRVIHERFARLKAQRTENFIHFGGHLDTEPTLEGLEEWVKRTEPKPLIVVDSMIRFLEDGSESDSKVISKFFAPLRKLSQLGATIIVLHHTGKGESTREYRGSSDIKTALDIGWTMSNAGVSELTEMKLKLFKNRVAAPEELALKYEDGNFLLGTPDALERSTLAQLLYDHSGIVQKEFVKLATERGLGRNKAQRFVEDGIVSGEVLLKKGSNNSTWLYSKQRMAFEQPGSVAHLQ
jgi:archaellum biogenesis ATPase FlaH